ncbi:MAG: PIN domain-containing protein [Acidobacteriota bacterium]
MSSMPVDCFVDTNILVYAAAGREQEEGKRRRALRIIEDEDISLSAQVLQEFYVTVTRKIAVPLSPDQAVEWIEELEAFPCLSIGSALVKIAVEVSLEHQISYWDAAIVAAAQTLGAPILYSEDLNDEQHYGPVQVRNPFANG